VIIVYLQTLDTDARQIARGATRHNLQRIAGGEQYLTPANDAASLKLIEYLLKGHSVSRTLEWRFPVRSKRSGRRRAGHAFP
jgi:hypothetical protein